jgi:hypothetical protein
MASIVLEYMYNGKDNINVNKEKRMKLQEAVKGKTCETIMKNKNVCGRAYRVDWTGRCGCQFHENYSHALQALRELEPVENR